MMEIKITGETNAEILDGIVNAFYLLHDAQGPQMQQRLIQLMQKEQTQDNAIQVLQQQKQPQQQQEQKPLTVASAPVIQAPVAPVNAQPVQQQAGVSSSPPMSAHYQIGKYAADNFPPGSPKRQQFEQLMSQYGITQIQQLRPEQLNSFAAALQQLGATQ